MTPPTETQPVTAAPTASGPAPGYYYLTADVPNPRPDRCSKAMHSVPVWKKGQRVKIKYNPEVLDIWRKAGRAGHPPFGRVEFRDHTEVDFNLDGGLRDIAAPELSHGNPLLAALVPAALTLGQFLRDAWATPAQLLAHLIDTNRLTLGDLKEVERAVRQADEAALEASDARHEI